MPSGAPLWEIPLRAALLLVLMQHNVDRTGIQIIRVVGVDRAIGSVVNHHQVVHVRINNWDGRGARRMLCDRLAQGYQNIDSVLV